MAAAVVEGSGAAGPGGVEPLVNQALNLPRFTRRNTLGGLVLAHRQTNHVAISAVHIA